MPATAFRFLRANGMIAVLGTVISPGGTINVTGGNTASPSDNQLLFYNASPDQPFPTVDLGPSSVLSAVGVFEQTANVDGLTTGSVLPGGSITVQGNIVAEWGAVLDVSGASVYIDEPASATGESGGGLQEQLSTGDLVSSNGGAITLKGKQLLYTDATLLGFCRGKLVRRGQPHDFPAAMPRPAIPMFRRRGPRVSLSLFPSWGSIAGIRFRSVRPAAWPCLMARLCPLRPAIPD